MIKSPPNANHVKGIVATRIAALEERKDNIETVIIEWRGTTIPVPVITLPVDLVVYNPDTHRIRAQRETDPVGARALASAPWGSDAQGYLHRLLMGDPKNPSKIDPSFTALKQDLLEHGQNDPGIVTQAGVLINGNTRRAALKENGQEFIRVGVLPSDAGAEDIHGIELSLQLRKDHRRDYSFMNYLLAIDEQVAEGLLSAVIQKKFRMKASAFDRALWILNFVRDAISRSSITTGNGAVASLNLVDFESHQGKLEELYKAYVSASVRSPEDAQALCEQRLLALLLNKSKTDLRLIDPDFTERYMKEMLPNSSADPEFAIPGTTIKVPGDSANVRALKDLTNSALRAKAVSNNGLMAAAKDVEAAALTMTTLDKAVDKALTHAGRQARMQQRKVAAAERISDACEDLDLAIDEVARARAVSQFAPDDIDEALLGLKKSIEKLGAIVARGGDSASDGAMWITAVCSMPSAQR